ncbi:MAG: hypothetical protein ACK4HE_03040 [Chitinophagaceae bacterium]
MSNDAFENEIKAQLAELYIQPDASVWHQVSTQIQPKEKRRKAFIWWWLAASMVVLLTGAYYIYHHQAMRNLTVNTSKAKTNASMKVDTDEEQSLVLINTPLAAMQHSKAKASNRGFDIVDYKTTTTKPSVSNSFKLTSTAKSQQEHAVSSGALMLQNNLDNTIMDSFTHLHLSKAQELLNDAANHAEILEQIIPVNALVEHAQADSNQNTIITKDTLVPPTKRRWVIACDAMVGIATTNQNSLFKRSNNTSSQGATLGNTSVGQQPGGNFTTTPSSLTVYQSGISIRLGLNAKRILKNQLFIYVSGAYQWNTGSIVVGAKKDSLVNVNGVARNYAYIGGMQERKMLSEHSLSLSSGIGNTFKIHQQQIHPMLGFGTAYMVAGNRLHTDITNTIAIDALSLYNRMQFFIEPQVLWQPFMMQKWTFGVQAQLFLNSISKGNSGGYRNNFHVVVRKNF